MAELLPGEPIATEGLNLSNVLGVRAVVIPRRKRHIRSLRSDRHNRVSESLGSTLTLGEVRKHLSRLPKVGEFVRNVNRSGVVIRAVVVRQ
jgi:hypothetical protein